MTDDITDNRIGRKGPYLVKYRRDGFGLELVVPAGELNVPKLKHHGIGAVRKRFFTELLVGQHTRDIKHSGIWPVQKCQNGIAQNVFKPRSPTFTEHPFQYANDFRADVRLLVRIGDFKRVKT